MDQYGRQSEDSGQDNAYSLGPRRQNMGRDPVSHRIIEKRRRDRMNQCLTQLSHLLPKSYTEKRCGRVEKTEIVELAIQYIKYLVSMQQTSAGENSGSGNTNQQLPFVQGFCQCASEVMHFAVSSKNADPSCSSEYFLARLRYHLENVCNGMGTGTKLEDWLRDVDNVLNLPMTRGSEELDDDCFDRPCDGMRMSKRQRLPDSSYQSGFTNTSTSCSTSTSDDGLTDRNKPVYKFKDRMKQRFTGGHSSSDSSNSPQPNTSDSNTDSDNKQDSPHHHEVEDDEPLIPCFALFANKSNYTPLAVPARLLRQYTQSQNGNRGSTVHPISITVEYGDGTVIKQEMI